MGYVAEKVEQRLPIPNRFVTRDLFGFADIVYCDGKVIGAVQATTTSNLSARHDKVRRLDALRLWLDAGGRFALWGWSKRGPKGKRKTWQLTIRGLDGQNLEVRRVQS